MSKATMKQAMNMVATADNDLINKICVSITRFSHYGGSATTNPFIVYCDFAG